MLRNPVSKKNVISISLGLLALAALAAMSLSLMPRAAQADERHGDLLVKKNCSAFTGGPGSYCMITDSNLPEIEKGSKLYYDQPAAVVSGLLEGGLDSNVVLYVDTGDWAVGRCTLDGITNLGLCTFSDGTGTFIGFHARVNVSSADGLNYSLDGTYSFNRDHD
jgi:hypothetical protein